MWRTDVTRGSMLKRRSVLFTLLSLTMLVIFTFSLAANPFNYASAQVEREKRVNTEKVVGLVEKAEEHIRLIFANLEGGGVKMPDAAKEVFERGRSKVRSAAQALSEGRTDAAAEESIAAMGHFEKSMRYLIGVNVTAPIPAKMGIEQAANRTRVFLEKLEEIAKNAEEGGYNTGDITARISRAKTILSDVEALTDKGLITEAAKKLGEARSATAGVTGDLNRVTKEEKSKKIKEFTDKAVERLTEIEQKADLLPPQAAGKVKAAAERAKTHISKAKNLVEEKKLEQAVDELEEMVKDADEGDNNFRKEIPAAASKMKEEFTKLENRVVNAQQKIDTLKDAATVKAVREKLGEAKTLLQKASDELRNGDYEAAANAIKNLEKLLDNIERSLKNSSEKNGGRGDEGRGRQ